MPMLHNLVVAGATILFQPGPGWNWSGWNGMARLTTAIHGAAIFGNGLANANDVPTLVRALIGRAYAALDFDAVPGIVSAGTVTVHGATLSQAVTSDGAKALLNCTSGTFVIQCTPALNSVGVPDPIVIKTGRWMVHGANQTHTKAE